MVGSRGATLLWVRLMEQHAADPAALQWLPVLACWLSDSAALPPASEQHSQAAMHGHDSTRQPLGAAQQPAEAEEGAIREHVAGKEAPRKDIGHMFRRGSPEAKRPPEAAQKGQDGATSPVSRPSPRRDNGGALNRSVEEALSLQEAATRIGYGAAALPLWQAFLQRFFRYKVLLLKFLQRFA